MDLLITVKFQLIALFENDEIYYNMPILQLMAASNIKSSHKIEHGKIKNAFDKALMLVTLHKKGFTYFV